MENKQEVKKETISIMAGSAVVGFIVVALCVAGLLLIKPAGDLCARTNRWNKCESVGQIAWTLG